VALTAYACSLLFKQPDDFIDAPDVIGDPGFHEPSGPDFQTDHYQSPELAHDR